MRWKTLARARVARGRSGRLRSCRVLSAEPKPRGPLPATTLFCGALGRAGAGDTVSLDSGEIAHTRALRLGAGDAVLVTDGCGRRWEAELTGTGRRTRAGSRRRGRRPLPGPSRCGRPSATATVAVAGREGRGARRATHRPDGVRALPVGGRRGSVGGLPRPRPTARDRGADAVRRGAPSRALGPPRPGGGVRVGGSRRPHETAAVAGLAVLAAALDAATGARAGGGERASPGIGPVSATSPGGGRSADRRGEL